MDGAGTALRPPPAQRVSRERRKGEAQRVFGREVGKRHARR